MQQTPQSCLGTPQSWTPQKRTTLSCLGTPQSQTPTRPRDLLMLSDTKLVSSTGHTPDRKQIKTEGFDPCIDKPAFPITAKRGTMKRKRQVREAMACLDKGCSDDIFESTPLKKRRKIIAVKCSCLYFTVCACMLYVHNSASACLLHACTCVSACLLHVRIFMVI